MRLTHSLTLTPLCLLTAFILTLLTPICSHAAEQQVIQAPALGHGILRRYEARDVDIEQVIHVALDEDLDIWQITPDHVDIYSPPAPDPQIAYTQPSSQFQDYPHCTTVIPTPHIHTPPNPSPDLPQTNWTSLPATQSPFHTAYHPLFEIEAFLSQLERTHPGVMRVMRVGISGEGREVLGVEIRKGEREVGKRGKEKMGFVITGAQHAREWVATSTALYLTHALVGGNGSETGTLAALLDTYAFYIIPAPNPDGYVYTWESDRFWYKNRMRTSPDPACVGVDMNRNWGYKWTPSVPLTFSNTTTTSQTPQPQPNPESKKKKKKHPPSHPCSHWYPGNRPFQAPEVHHIATYIETLPNLKAFVDLRSYGQMLSSPFSYSCTKFPKDAENQLEAASGAVSALRQPYGTAFMTGTLCSMFYKAHGNIVDWMYKRAGIKYSYAAHLRDTGTYGFALPPQLIRPVGEETANMIEYLANFIARIEK